MNSGRELLLERARDVAAGEGGVASPCISVCRMHAQTGLCEGCFRTLEEIAAWSQLDDAGKRAVWQGIEARALEAA
jgi:predicted Fe-S protein YdhL (DUF1289 family)